MAEYNPRQEVMTTQQSLLEEYEHQLSCETEENMTAVSHLSQCEQEVERVPCGKVQVAVE